MVEEKDLALCESLVLLNVIERKCIFIVCATWILYFAASLSGWAFDTLNIGMTTCILQIRLDMFEFFVENG